jgi:hypothetical protein
MNKKVTMSLIAVAATAGLATMTATKVLAFGRGEGNMQMHESIAERFNLNQDEVNQFFEEQHQAHQEERQSQMEALLNNAVSEGKITQAQKEAIQAKREENRANKENGQDLTREERQAQIQTHREEMHAWAEEQGIDMETLNLGRGGTGEGRRHGGFGGGRMGKLQ